MSRALLVLVATIGCRGRDMEDDTSPVLDDTDSGTPSVEVEIIDLNAGVLEAVQTVLELEWSTDLEVVSHVEFGETDALGLSTASSEPASTAHEALLLGMPADTEVFYQVVSTTLDGTVHRGALLSTSTGSLPASYPEFTLNKISEPLDGYLVCSLTGAIWAPIILDGQGRIVWYYEEDRGFNVYRARLSRDRQAILYNAVGVGDFHLINESQIVRVSLTGEVEASYSIPYLTHDFVELPDGDVVGIAYDTRTIGDEDVRGDKLVHIDSETGTPSVVWSTWDDFTPGLHGYDDGDDTWTHANALDYDEEEDAFYLSVRDLGSIIKIDRKTGTLEWGLSGHANTFEFIGEADGWELEHQFELTGNRMLVFDNGDSERASSYVQEYELDFDAMTAEQTWFHEADPSLFVYALGDVDPLANDDVLITWATGGLFQRVSREGEIKWELGSPLGYAIGYTQVLDTLYLSSE